MLQTDPSHNGTINNIHSTVSSSIQQKVHVLLANYQDHFEGLVNLKDINLKIHVNPSIIPVVQKPRWLPTLVQQELNQEMTTFKC